MNKIKVLVVDDSALMRLLISDMLASDLALEVVGAASDGYQAIVEIEILKPDIITLDVQMPALDGLEVLKRIRQECPTKVIVVTGLKNSDVAYEALSLGAIDFVSKPSGPYSPDIDEVKEELIEKVKMAASVNLAKVMPSTNSYKFKTGIVKRSVVLKKIVAIGASAGGPPALEKVLSALSAGLPASFLVVQHLPAGFVKSLVKRLNFLAPFEVREARGGEPIEPDVVYFAPSGYHLTVARSKGCCSLKLDKSRPVCGARPSIDKLMASVAAYCGKRAIGVVLSGMGRDGASGMKAIKARGGKTIVQDEKTSVVFSMPKAAIAEDAVDKILPLDRIAKEIERIITRG